jgi:hypothetical protein
MEKAGYDPRGIGANSWGSITGYTREEVGEIPRMNSDPLRGYFDETLASIRRYLETTSDELLDQASIGSDGKQTNYFWIRLPLFDQTRHVGEMLAMKAMWDRKTRE